MTSHPSVGVRVLMIPIRMWRLVSRFLAPRCRFYPSCSAYALDALDEHGAARGSWLAMRRLGRCHPWNPGGIDPVPSRHATARDATSPDTNARSAPKAAA